MSDVLDPMKLVQDCARESNAAKTREELDAVWTKHVRPVYDKLDEEVLHLLHSIYAKNLTILMKG